MGHIVYWGILRTAALIVVLWISYDWIEYKVWWMMISAIAIYGVIIHPVIVQYKNFTQKNKEVIDNTLCSTCKHFDESAILCMKYDQHPTKDFIPCDGIDWEVN